MAVVDLILSKLRDLAGYHEKRNKLQPPRKAEPSQAAPAPKPAEEAFQGQRRRSRDTARELCTREIVIAANMVCCMHSLEQCDYGSAGLPGTLWQRPASLDFYD